VLVLICVRVCSGFDGTQHAGREWKTRHGNGSQATRNRVSYLLTVRTGQSVGESAAKGEKFLQFQYQRGKKRKKKKKGKKNEFFAFLEIFPSHRCPLSADVHQVAQLAPAQARAFLDHRERADGL
jgi:hypothetical protein